MRSPPIARSAANQGLPVPSTRRALRIKTSILVAVMVALLSLYTVRFFLAVVKEMAWPSLVLNTPACPLTNKPHAVYFILRPIGLKFMAIKKTDWSDIYKERKMA